MGRTACTEPQCLYKGDLYFYIFDPKYAMPVADRASLQNATHTYVTYWHDQKTAAVLGGMYWNDYKTAAVLGGMYWND
jgi:hypothetical protein